MTLAEVLSKRTVYGNSAFLKTNGECKVVIEADADNNSGEEAAILEVASDSKRVKGHLRIPQGTSNNLELVAGGDLSNSISSDLLFYTKSGDQSPTVKMTIRENGKVGIGTTLPFDALTIQEIGGITINNDSSAYNVIKVYNSGGVELELVANANNIGTLKTMSNHPITITPNNTEVLRVKQTGQVRFNPLSADPASPQAGDVYYNSTTNKLRCYNGSVWNDLF